VKEQEKQLRHKLYDLAIDLQKELDSLNMRDTKAGKARVRKLTLNLEKVGKEYRKVSIKV